MIVKKRILPILMAILLVITMMPVIAGTAYAESEITVNGVKYSLNDNDKTAAISGHTTDLSGEVVIPDTVTSNGDTYTVTSIGQDAFFWCEGLTSITIPKNVTSIGEGAFYRCTSLGTVGFAEGSKLESIGKSAFSMCTRLTSITIPESVTSIDEDAFGGCDSLTTIHFGGSPSQWEAITGGGKPNNGPTDYGIKISLKLSVYDAANNSFPDADDPAYITSATISGKDTRTAQVPVGGKATIVITPADGYMVQGVKVNDSQTPWNVVQDFQSWTDPKTGVHTITFSPPAGADYEFSVSLHEAVRVTYDLNGGTVGNNWLGNTRIVSKGSVVTGIGYEFEKITPPAGKFLSAVEITTASGVYTIAAAKLNSTAHKYDSDVTFKCIWGPFTQTITASDFTKTYGDAPFSLGAKTNGDGRLTYKSADTKVVTVDSTGKVTIKGAGTAKITISAAATADYQAASKTITVTVRKATNPLTMKVKTATVKYKKLKKKTQTLKVSKVIKFTKKGQGTMQYKLYSVKKGKKSFKKYFKIASKSGKVTVKKGLKRGTYKVRVKVKAGGNANYQPSAWKTETFKIRVK